MIFIMSEWTIKMVTSAVIASPYYMSSIQAYKDIFTFRLDRQFDYNNHVLYLPFVIENNCLVKLK